MSRCRQPRGPRSCASSQVEGRKPQLRHGYHRTSQEGLALIRARAHLEANSNRYRVDENDLRTLEVLADSDTSTVRFGQTYKGLEVFGAQYLVHMERGEDGLATVSVNGHYFTDLDVNVMPQLNQLDARRLAVYRMRAIRVDRVERRASVSSARISAPYPIPKG